MNNVYRVGQKYGSGIIVKIDDVYVEIKDPTNTNKTTKTKKMICLTIRCSDGEYINMVVEP